MIPWNLLPGLGGLRLKELAERPEPLWIHGESGTGRSGLAAELAALRRGACLDEGEPEAAALERWLKEHPRGVVVAAKAAPDARFLALRLPPLQEAPAALPALLAAIAREEGLQGALPESLSRLPCPGNLRGLRNRVVRYRLLGQLPESEAAPDPAGPPRFEAEDLATNLHQLEAFLLHRALRRSYGNRAEAAKRLGVSRRQLYLLIARHGDPVRGEAPTGALPKRVAKRHREGRE